MKLTNILSSLLLLLISQIVWSQQNLPLIHAQSNLVDIRDGEDFNKGGWSLAPEAKPDIYTSNKIGKQVIFYTDLDSISYTIHPDSVFDFIILYQNKDTAYTQIRYEPSYLDILKKAEDFDFKDQTKIPTFTYQDSSNVHLKSLRKAFNLDSIAGGGNEISRILNLLHWIHDLIPHDGNHENPEVRNAFSLINQCKKEARGLNCRGLATVLNECYLAMGMKSRFVTCMPKDSIFNDCHVINMVYSNDYQKWIWVDPTHDAYVMNETGILLNFDEVRERLIQGEALILNPTANWNRQFSTLKESYLLEYMAKNLYRFSCPLNSQYDYETPEKGKFVEYVELLPLDGFQQLPKVFEKTYSKSGRTMKTYKTNNPELFWAKPK